MKNLSHTDSFEQLWLDETESKMRFPNRFFCIVIFFCNPVSAFTFYLERDPFLHSIFLIHLLSNCVMLVLFILHYQKRITGQKMSFYAFNVLVVSYGFLLTKPQLSYVQSCVNLTLFVIFAGLILRWPVRYAIFCAVVAILVYPLAIYSTGIAKLFAFFEDGGFFLIIAYVIFPFVIKLNYNKDKQEFFYRYTLRRQNEALEAQKVIAENATRAKSDFLSMMSHEIRTPLNGIVGIVHLMMQETEKASSGWDLLQTLKFSADHLMAVVNEVLDFNKINSNHVVLDHAPFDPALMFENLRQSFLPRTTAKNIGLVFDVDPQLPARLVADKVRLNQIITNLIHNAIKFTVSGSVRFHVRILEKTETLVSVRFEVIDTGIGIPEPEQQKIFENFTQVDSAAHREHGGTGLGLAISKELLRLFGSEIRLSSVEGKGSVFSFILNMPYSENAEEPSEIAGKKAEPLAFPPARVLVVDDNKTNVMLATLLLTRKNVEFDVAVNGKEAFDMFCTGQYNLILMDLRMPVMDGFESTALIRQRNKSIPIIALTASAFQNEKERAMASGFTGYLTKPFIPEDFYKYIFPFLTDKTAENRTN